MSKKNKGKFDVLKRQEKGSMIYIDKGVGIYCNKCGGIYDLNCKECPKCGSKDIVYLENEGDYIGPSDGGGGPIG